MKTIKGISACFLIACLVISCKKKEDAIEMNNQTEVTATASDSTMATPTATDTVANTASPSADTQGTNKKSGNAVSTSHSDSPPGNQGKSARAKGKNLSGYSAPDGTDAENNDGDQYTKNDKKRMPSGGSSIK